MYVISSTHYGVCVCVGGVGGGGGGGLDTKLLSYHTNHIAIPIIKIRWNHDCLLFIMEILIHGKIFLYWSMALGFISTLTITIQYIYLNIVNL